MGNSLPPFSSPVFIEPPDCEIRDYEMADWKYEKVMEQIYEFEQTLDDDHEVALRLAYFGASIIMNVSSIGYQDPDLLYFYGKVNGQESQLIQHMNQLNFLLTAIDREDKTKPARRIGFLPPNDDKED